MNRRTCIHVVVQITTLATSCCVQEEHIHGMTQTLCTPKTKIGRGHLNPGPRGITTFAALPSFIRVLHMADTIRPPSTPSLAICTIVSALKYTLILFGQLPCSPTHHLAYRRLPSAPVVPFQRRLAVPALATRETVIGRGRNAVPKENRQIPILPLHLPSNE